MKNPYDTTLWEKISWALFGEWRIVYFLGGLGVAFWLGLTYVIYHFIAKYW